MLNRRKFNVKDFPPSIRAKWPVGMLDEGFTPFPKRFLRCLGELFGESDALDDVRVLTALADYQRAEETPPARIEMLAAIAGLPPARFCDRLNELKRREF